MDKGSRVAGLAGRRAQTSRCAGDCPPVSAGAEHVHTGQHVNHFNAAVPVNVRAEYRGKHADWLLLILGCWPGSQGRGEVVVEGGSAYRARQHKLLLREMSRDQEVCRLTPG